MTEPGSIKKQAIAHLYNASQLRADTWSRLRHLAQALFTYQTDTAKRKSLREEIARNLKLVEPVQRYWAFPGTAAFRRLWSLLEQEDDGALHRLVVAIVRALAGNTYRRRPVSLPRADEELDEADEPGDEGAVAERPYFEVLVVDSIPEEEEERLRAGLRAMRRPEDRFVYEIVVVPSLEDAQIAVLFNPTIQTCVIHEGFRRESAQDLGPLERYLERVESFAIDSPADENPSIRLARIIGELRPEIDCFLVTDLLVESIAGRTPWNVRRVFYHKEDWLELHLNMLRGINDRYKTPFFTALKDHSAQPTGVFHAMPISRGKSITKSHWIQDMARFYGMNIFLAETSATSGGLDSLLDPQGPIKKAQERAARAFGAKRTFFVTNGTSTANKIVLQGLIQPGDIVLVDRNCHKSHHYGFVLAGASVCYLDSFPIDAYSMYGAVPLAEIKKTLLAYRRAGILDRVKMVLLTNCTFDGIVYHVERVMQECLAIKPDLVFLWDEAWFAFARFDPVYRQRTAMASARKLRRRYDSESYRREYEDFRARFGDPDPENTEAWLSTPLLPDPGKVRLRVYSTQSTHKTLTALRQGSMIHVYDQDFAAKTEESFHEALMTHTSTSPNYQIVASLDLGRRQVELEGFELVQKQTEMAMVLRERVMSHPVLKRYFRFLTVEDLIPGQYRESGLAHYFDDDHGWAPMIEAWAHDEFVLDPCRLTLFIGETGIDGNTFKNQHLMQKHGIQINKTSWNTVLFMTNIGTTRSSVAYLIEVLVKIAGELKETEENSNRMEWELQRRAVASLTLEIPPLPSFGRFHGAFLGSPMAATPDGDIRGAYYLAGNEENCEYLRPDDLDEHLRSGREVVAAKFITPYPPGFPMLVPGQIVTPAIAEFLRRYDVTEIHGYEAELGLRVFKESALGAGEAPLRRTSRAARAAK